MGRHRLRPGRVIFSSSVGVLRRNHVVLAETQWRTLTESIAHLGAVQGLCRSCTTCGGLPRSTGGVQPYPTPHPVSRARRPWSTEECSQGKSAKRTRNFGTRVGSAPCSGRERGKQPGGLALSGAGPLFFAPTVTWVGGPRGCRPVIAGHRLSGPGSRLPVPRRAYRAPLEGNAELMRARGIRLFN